MDRNELTFSSSDSDDEFAMIVIGLLLKERVYRNRYDPLVEYDDADFVRRFRYLIDIMLLEKSQNNEKYENPVCFKFMFSIFECDLSSI